MRAKYPRDLVKNNARDTTNFITRYLQTDVVSYVEAITSAIKT